ASLRELLPRFLGFSPQFLGAAILQESASPNVACRLGELLYAHSVLTALTRRLECAAWTRRYRVPLKCPTEVLDRGYPPHSLKPEEMFGLLSSRLWPAFTGVRPVGLGCLAWSLQRSASDQHERGGHKMAAPIARILRRKAGAAEQLGRFTFQHGWQRVVMVKKHLDVGQASFLRQLA